MYSLKNTLFKISLGLFIALSASQSSYAEDYADTPKEASPSAEAMMFDGLILRPLHLAGTIIGTGIFVVTLPFSLLGGNVEQAGETLVVEPAAATFTNCLGCIGRDKRKRH